MYFGEIKDCDIANGTGVRVSLFVSGCTNRCKNCFQPQTWDFDYGKPFTQETEDRLLRMLNRPFIHGLTLLGGDPFEPRNQEALVPFLKRVKAVLPQKTIWAFSGFTYEQICDPNHYPHSDVSAEMLSMIDVLVDGRFVESLKDISLQFRGSSNQRIIDIQKTMEAHVVVLWKPQLME